MSGLARRVAVARGDEPADLVVRGGTVLSVFTREWLEADVAVVDGFVAGVTGGLRRYHERRDAPVETLRMTLPISIRTPSDPVGGNRITLIRFAVPVDETDPALRIREIGRLCRAARGERSLPYTDAIAGTLNLLPHGVVGSMLKHVDFLASNVPGLDAPIFVGGARVSGLYPFGPTIGAALNVTLLSYCGTCNVGINTDTGAVPDPEALTACLREGFEEVLALGGAHAPVVRPGSP